MKKRLVWIFTSLFVLGLGGALLAPVFLPWHDLKPLIEHAFYVQTGRPMKIQGSVGVQLLPHPEITLQKIAVYEHEKEKKPFLTLKKLFVSVPWQAVFQRKPMIQSIRGVKPQGHLYQRESWDTTPYHFKPITFVKKPPVLSTNSKIIAMISGAFMGVPTPSSSKEAKNVTSKKRAKGQGFRLGNIEITKAAFYLHTKQGQTHAIHDISILLSPKTLEGPYMLDGFFKVNNLSGRISSELEGLGPKKPFTLQMDLPGFDIEAQGILFPEKGLFQGDTRIEIQKDFFSSLKIPALLSPRLQDIFYPFTFVSYVNLYENRLQLQNTVVKAADATLKGTGDLSWSPFMTFSSSLRGLPGDVHMQLNKTQKAPLWKISLDISQPSKTRAWLQNTMPPSFSMKKVPFLQKGPFVLRATYDQKPHYHRCQDIHIQDDDALIIGYVSFQPSQRILTHDLKANKTFLKRLSFIPKDLLENAKEISVEGSHRWDGQKQNIKNHLKVSYGRMLMTTKGHINVSNKKPLVNQHWTFHKKNPTTSSQKSLKSQGHLVYEKDQLTLSDVQGSLSMDDHVQSITHLDFQGTAKIKDFKTPKVEGSIVLMPTFQKQVSHKKETSSSSKTGDKKEVVKVPPLPLPAFLDLSWASSSSGHLNVDIKPLGERPYYLEKNLQGPFSWQDGQVTIGPLKGSIFEGMMTLQLKMSHEKMLIVHWEMGLLGGSLRKISQETLTKLPNGKGILSGALTMGARMTHRGETIEALLKSMNGEITLETKGARFHGVHMPTLVKKLKGMKSIHSLAGLFVDTSDDGSTLFEDTKATIPFEDGLGTLTPLTLVGEGVSIAQKAFFNMPLAMMKSESVLTFTGTDVPKIPILVHGPFKNPEVSYDLSEIQQRLMTGVLVKAIPGAILGGPVGVVISDVFGGILGNALSDIKKSPQKSSP